MCSCRIKGTGNAIIAGSLARSCNCGSGYQGRELGPCKSAETNQLGRAGTKAWNLWSERNTEYKKRGSILPKGHVPFWGGLPCDCAKSELVARRLASVRGRVVALAQKGEEFKFFGGVTNDATEVRIDLTVSPLGIAELQNAIRCRRGRVLNLLPGGQPVLSRRYHLFSFHWRISSGSS